MNHPNFAGADQHLAIREAHAGDAASACLLVRASIVDLCHLDHEGDRGLLAAWLANKTPDNVRTWIARSHVFLAERNAALVGVAAVTDAGEITLTYVSPAHRFTGVSKALLFAMEERARDLGRDHCTLTSTKTALSFYRGAGYADVEGRRGQSRMLKRL